MVKPAAHNSLDKCSNHFGLTTRVLELVDRINLSFIDFISCGSDSLLGY